MFERIKRALTAQLPEISVVLDAAPPAESEIEATRAAVRAERVRLKRSVCLTGVSSCVTAFLVFCAVTLLDYNVPDIDPSIYFIGALAGALAWAGAFDGVFAFLSGAFAFAFAGGVLAFAGASAGALAFVLAGALIFVFGCICLVEQFDRLEKFELSLAPAPKDACLEILAWKEDSVIASYCEKVVAERQFIVLEVEAMRAWIVGAEQRKAIEARQAEVENACRMLYGTT